MAEFLPNPFPFADGYKKPQQQQDWYQAGVEKKERMAESPFSRSPVHIYLPHPAFESATTFESLASLQSELDDLLDRVSGLVDVVVLLMYCR